MGGEDEAAHGSAGRTRFELEADESQEGLGVAGRRGKSDGARVAAVGGELQGDLEARAREGAGFQAREEALEGGVGEKEKRLEGGEGRRGGHALGEGGRRQVRLERTRVDGARGDVEVAADLTQTAGDFAFGQLREIADRGEAPALEGRGDLHLRREALERERREKA